MQQAVVLSSRKEHVHSRNRKPLIALAGNPNSGKTTLFNTLTGLRYKVANYPGVTVERKEGKLFLPRCGEATLMDLPGTYGIAGTSIDEQLATKVLLGEVPGLRQPDTIVVVVDATNLERNLYLTTQIIDVGVPVVVALSMTDLAEKNGISIKKEVLARQLGVPVVSLVAPQGHGVPDLLTQLDTLLSKETHALPCGAQFAWLPEKHPIRKAALQLGHLEIGNGATPHGKALMVGCALLSDARIASNPELNVRLTKTREELRASYIDPISSEATLRYQWINSLVKRCCSFPAHSKTSFADRIDWITTHRVFGVITFIALMAFIFQSIFLWASLPMAWIDSLVFSLGNILGTQLPEGMLRSLVVDGIVSGVGSVLIFIPQIAILFFFIGLLEDSGYLARAAFVTDKLMRKVGLQGRSFIPLLSSFACAIPGILSTRTIPTFADRLATILIAPLMSCSARLPVYSLLIAAFIPPLAIGHLLSLQGLVLFAMYALGIVGAMLVAWILKHTILKSQPAYFVMEMPPFRAPSLKIVIRDVVDRVMSFVKNAGTIILACSIVLWFLASYPQGAGRESYARQIGHVMEPVIKPLGFNWEIGVGLLASFAAREVFVSSLATVYNVSDAEETSHSVLSELEKRRTSGAFTLATALSLMVFYVFACQCMSTVAVCRRETGSWRWTAFMFTYMTLLAYGASFVTYQIASRLLS